MLLITCAHLAQERAYLYLVLDLIRLDSTAHIHAPGPDLADSIGHVLGAQAAGQEDTLPPRGSLGQAPIVGGSAAAPAGCRRVQQQAPGCLPVSLELAQIAHIVHMDSLNDRA